MPLLPNPWIILAGVAFLLASVASAYTVGRSHGYDKRSAEYEQVQKEASDAARKIERDAVPCSNDPTCVLPDPFRRRVPGVQPNSGVQ
jgi:hypothetical protein